MANDTAIQISTALQNLSLGHIIGLFAEVVISSVILYFSVRLVGGKYSFKRSIFLTIVMEVLNVMILPVFLTGVMSLLIYILLWLVFVTVLFELPIWKAILVALVQLAVSLLFAVLSIVALIATAFGMSFL